MASNCDCGGHNGLHTPDCSKCPLEHRQESVFLALQAAPVKPVAIKRLEVEREIKGICYYTNFGGFPGIEIPLSHRPTTMMALPDMDYAIKVEGIAAWDRCHVFSFVSQEHAEKIVIDMHNGKMTLKWECPTCNLEIQALPHIDTPDFSEAKARCKCGTVSIRQASWGTVPETVVPCGQDKDP